ncbi:hypothetical protein [Pseudomonas aeruginosa]|uniref:hypothetical protein n=1 Tax=Pseudomonas aeruginosa TaxID=287 RepID=UPI001432A47C|nr:hypothetical protein [Pseudomonas aeruginosa]NKC40642.1 hypothetical protein [Pseudomonas aeruginosa]
MYKALAFLLLNTFIAVVHAEEGWELSVSGPAPGPMSSTLEIIHKYHIISAQISAWEKPF